MKKYLLTITSNSTNEREYSVDCRNVLKLANQYGRCEGGEGLRVVRYMLVCRGGALGAVWCVDRCVVCRSLSSAGSRLCFHARAYTREQIPHMRPLPPKKIFLPPFRGARFLAERPFSARRRKPCYDFCVGRPGRQAQRPTGKSKHRGERICRTRA